MPKTYENTLQILDVGAALEALDTRRAAVNANWNGQNPDLMTPEQLKALLASTLALNEASANLSLAVGAFVGPARV